MGTRRGLLRLRVLLRLLRLRGMIERDVWMVFGGRVGEEWRGWEEALEKEGIHAVYLDEDENGLEEVSEEHWKRMCERACSDEVSPRPYLICVVSGKPEVVEEAVALGNVGIGDVSGEGKEEDLVAAGASCVAEGLLDLCRAHKIDQLHQLYYLPVLLHIQHGMASKMGYPVSFLDVLPLHGSSNPSSSSPSSSPLKESDRWVPRRVLGIEPNSLYDSYVNNIGYTLDSVGKGWSVNTRDVERDVIRMAGALFNLAPDVGGSGALPVAEGFVTSGGTEGNFAGLWWGREVLRDATGSLPILLLSDQAHYSVAKAGHQLGLEPRVVPSDPTGAIDMAAFDALLSEIFGDPDGAGGKPSVLVVATLGTTQSCALDPLPSMVASLKTWAGEGLEGEPAPQWVVHVDAAFIGPALPYIRPWDRDLDLFGTLGVATLAVSGHKLFGSVAISGIVLTTGTYMIRIHSLLTGQPKYISGLHDITPSGSRSGHAVLSLHNTLSCLGLHRDGEELRQLVEASFALKDKVISLLIGIYGPDLVFSTPHGLNVLFPRPSPEIMAKYILMPTSGFGGIVQDAACLCVLPNLTPGLVKCLVRDCTNDHRASDCTNDHRASDGSECQ